MLTGGLLRFVQLFFHDFQHYSGTQLKAVLEQQALCYGLIFTDSICVSGEQFFLFVRHGGLELFFVPANQAKGFFIFLAGICVIVGCLDVAIPKFFQKSHTASSS